MSGVSNLLERLKIIKDLDPFNQRLLNDCYDTITELSNKLDTLEKQLYELAGTEQKL
jgi:peptidoglycan hydrolase CwlO-like protein